MFSHPTNLSPTHLSPLCIPAAPLFSLRSWQEGVQRWQVQAWRELTQSLNEVARLIAKRSNQPLQPPPCLSKPTSPAMLRAKLSQRTSSSLSSASSSPSTRPSRPGSSSSSSIPGVPALKQLKDPQFPHPLGVPEVEPVEAAPEPAAASQSPEELVTLPVVAEAALPASRAASPTAMPHQQVPFDALEAAAVAEAEMKAASPPRSSAALVPELEDVALPGAAVAWGTPSSPSTAGARPGSAKPPIRSSRMPSVTPSFNRATQQSQHQDFLGPLGDLDVDPDSEALSSFLLRHSKSPPRPIRE